MIAKQDTNNCAGCDLCCRYYKIYLFPQEAKAIAKLLKIKYKDFVYNYLDLHIELYDLPDGFVSKEFFKLTHNFDLGKNIYFIPIMSLKKNDACVFLQNQLCTIYKKRPLICQQFPRFKYADEIYKFCKIDDGTKLSDLEKKKHYSIMSDYLKSINKVGFINTWKYLPDLKNIYINMARKRIENKELQNYFINLLAK